MNDNEIINNIFLSNFKIPKTISVQARTFLLSMLQKDGYNRLSASQLLNHDFIIRDYHSFTKYSNGINI
jgi:serine/threonine protein kinase